MLIKRSLFFQELKDSLTLEAIIYKSLLKLMKEKIISTHLNSFKKLNEIQPLI